MSIKKVENAREINLDAFKVTSLKLKDVCTVGILLNELSEISADTAKLLQSHLDNPDMALTNIQRMIINAGFKSRGWHQLKAHRDGFCICARVGN